MTSGTPYRTVAIETHGCKLNAADSQALAARFAAVGYHVVEPDQPAAIYILNTCTVTHVGDRKARRALRAARRRNPEGLVVAAGCYAQRTPEAVARVGGVNLVVGTRDKDRLVELALRALGEAPRAGAAEAGAPWSGASLFRTRAMLKIQEGCNQVCAYCIVPKVRGREQSVPVDVLVSQVSQRVSQGYNEVVLTGTQLGSYGFDLPEASLVALLKRLLEETPVRRLRVSSLQPQEVTSELLDLWEDPRLCPHFHLPLQSGSDAVLQRMHRRYTARQYGAAATEIWERLPHAAITTDVLVGFPGETDRDFDQSWTLCRALPFARIHVFPYSVRPGTGAAHLPDRVGKEAQAQRVDQLLAVAREQQGAFQQRMAGTVRPVLWENQGWHGGVPVWRGLTDNYLRVLAPAYTRLDEAITPTRLGAGATGDAVWGEPLYEPTPISTGRT